MTLSLQVLSLKLNGKIQTKVNTNEVDLWDAASLEAGFQSRAIIAPAQRFATTAVEDEKRDDVGVHFQDLSVRVMLFYGQLLTWGVVSSDILERVYRPEEGYIKGLMQFCSTLGAEKDYFTKTDSGKWYIKKGVSLKSLPHYKLRYPNCNSKHQFNFNKVRERAYRIKENGGKFTL